jgi:Flp pilus assembly pilin Flp
MLRRWFEEEDGQDAVEYALLAALVGIAAVLIWQAIVTQLGAAYVSADTAVQTSSACTPDPGGGGC